MTMRILTPADFTTMPWKNGQGSTLELFRTATWRLSWATIAASGPFSRFAGMDRIFIPLAPLTLHLPGACPQRLEAWVPLAFEGELAPEASLSGSDAVQALNLMGVRGEVALAAHVLTEARPIAVGVAETVAILPLSGPVLVDGVGLPRGHLALMAGPSETPVGLDFDPGPVAIFSVKSLSFA